MFETVKELLEKIRLGEDSFLELKDVRFSGNRVSGPKRDSLADELASFANAGGGVCVLGVDDSSRDVVGIPVDRLDAVEDFVRETATDSLEPPLPIVIERLLLPSTLGEEKAVLRVDVQKSLFVHKSPGGYLHRIGSSKREMRPDYLARLFQQRSQTRIIRFDEQAVPNATLADLDSELWERFRTNRSRTEVRESFLEKLGLVRRDEGGTPRPTVAGVLLATSTPRKFLPNAYIQAVAYRGTSLVPAGSDDEYQLDAADIDGPIDSQVTDALAFVRRNMRVSASKETGRMDRPQYDLTAVFEAVVNAVAHRDYSIHGSKIRLHMFADRLELYSPGALANTMSVESLSLRQAARNEVLTSMLARTLVSEELSGVSTSRAMLMDRRGEGVSIILERTEALSGRQPEYQVLDDAELLLTLFAAGSPPPDG
ncbi:MAG: transcriptional regulator [Deltaproteobacteria bacterium]|nr:MAG: transcriptional regulator [Deltaproteobacteria bacterium]